MHISELQKTIDNWITTYGVRYFNELTNMAILTEEVGEVSKLVARMYGEQSFREQPSAEEQKRMLADEMADVLWVLVCLANQTDIDLERAIFDNIQKKTKRDHNRHVNNQKINTQKDAPNH